MTIITVNPKAVLVVRMRRLRGRVVHKLYLSFEDLARIKKSKGRDFYVENIKAFDRKGMESLCRMLDAP